MVILYVILYVFLYVYINARAGPVRDWHDPLVSRFQVIVNGLRQVRVDALDEAKLFDGCIGDAVKIAEFLQQRLSFDWTDAGDFFQL